MVTLVADVGGTQSRLGLAHSGELDNSSVRRFSNSDFGSFYEVVKSYLSGGHANIEACVIALAGPISGGRGSFTNLDWVIDVEELKNVTKSNHALLINDLTSLGYSLNKLPAQSVAHISGPKSVANHNGQFLVVGMGTGFNVCPVLDDGINHPMCLQVESGHTALPQSVVAVLNERLPQYSVDTIEDVFAGNGLANLYKAVSGGTVKHGQVIVQEHIDQTNQLATDTLNLFAELLGVLLRDIILQYLPTGGVYFAGSVSRGVFEAGLGEVFAVTFVKQGHFLKDIDKIPVSLITDDGAGLLGCSARSDFVNG
jgi:glucokinase